MNNLSITDKLVVPPSMCKPIALWREEIIIRIILSSMLKGEHLMGLHGKTMLWLVKLTIDKLKEKEFVFHAQRSGQ